MKICNISLVLLCGIGIVGAIDNNGIELIRDRQFSNGIGIQSPTPGTRNVIGKISTENSKSKPIWNLAQWNSKMPFTNYVVKDINNFCISNVAKWICVKKYDDGSVSVSLGVDSRYEYKTLRKKSSEPWDHLLIQQQIVGSPSIPEISKAVLSMDFRLLETQTFKPEGFSPSMHTAHFQIVFTINNVNKKSPGYGDFLWFVIPIYDVRYELPPEYIARDFAETRGKLIFSPGAAAYGIKPLKVGEWQTLNCDIRPSIERAVKTAWERGYLQDSKDLSDYKICHLNLGWEVPGLNRVCIEFRNLSLKVYKN